MSTQRLAEIAELYLLRLGQEHEAAAVRASALAGAEVPAFAAVARAFGLDATALELLVLLAAADRDPRLWVLARSFHRDPLRTGFDCATAANATGLPVSELVAAADALRRADLVVGNDGPTGYRPFAPLFPVPRIVEALCGGHAMPDELDGIATLVDAGGAGDLVVPPRVVETVRAVLSRRDEQPPVLIVQGIEGVGKRALIRMVAAELGLRTLVVDGLELPHDAAALRKVTASLLREARLRGAFVLVDDADAIAEPTRRQVIAPLLASLARSPVLATTGGVVDCGPRGRAVVRVELPVPEAAGREQLWSRHLRHRTSDDVIAGIAARYAITPGLIARASASANLLAGAAPVTLEHVRDAIGAELAERFRGIGSPVSKHERWADLVLPPETQDAITDLVSRVRHRRRVVDEWGFGGKLAKGLGMSALFSGDPGTGKTMVAALIAEELGLQLYQVDLANLVSKYIGETEKNLARAFDAAEAGHAVLLFDEADALFGKRTSDVKSSTDRYANMEINYLLQRIERFSGVAILTTNLLSSIDPAFQRRLSVHVRFEMPDDDARAELWERMLPSAAPRQGELDFRTLGRSYKFSGGYIRNAVLRAAYLAAAENRGVAMDHLRRAADLEAWEMGRVAGHGRTTATRAARD